MLRHRDTLFMSYTEQLALGKPAVGDTQSVRKWLRKHKPLVPEEQDTFFEDVDDFVTARWRTDQDRHGNPIENWIETSLPKKSKSPITVCPDHSIF